MRRLSGRRAIVVGLTIVATMGVAATAPARTAQATRQPSAIADDTVGPLLFYRSGDGLASTGVVDSNGRYADLQNVGGFDRGWTHVVGAGGGRVLFYRSSDGFAAIGVVDSSGGYRDLRNVQEVLEPGFIRITYAGDRRLLFYRAIDGFASIGEVDNDGNFLLRRTFSLDRGWSQITYVGENRLLFYRSNTGQLAAGAIDVLLQFRILWSRPNTFTLMNSFVYAGGGQVLMYRPNDGTTLTGLVDNEGIKRLRIIGGLDLGWTSITYAGGNRLLFYRTSTGFAATGEVDPDGNFRDLANVGGFTPGWTRITTPLV